MKIKVYVAGPYTNGDVAINVRKAYEMADQLAWLGLYPFVPHHTHFWHLISPKEYEFWLDQDQVFLQVCDCLIRIPGLSNGADKEVELALSLSMPVFYDIDSLKTHYKIN